MGDSDGRGCPQIDVAAVVAISRLLPGLSRGYPIPSIFGGGGRKYLFFEGGAVVFSGPNWPQRRREGPPFFSPHTPSRLPPEKEAVKIGLPFLPLLSVGRGKGRMSCFSTSGSERPSSVVVLVDVIAVALRVLRCWD